MSQLLTKYRQVQRIIKLWACRFNDHCPHPQTSQMAGFTLIELLIASFLISIVILVAWTGFISVLHMSQAAQARTTRKFELNIALDVMTNEIRQATSINRSGSMVANGGTISVQDVVANSGIAMNDLGSYGEIALYLEIPINTPQKTCNSGGVTGPTETIDRVVYDIRDSPPEWLSPKVVARYGRIPQSNGSIDPCSSPINSDIIADGLSDINQTPACVGVLTGEQGFHTCTQSDAVQLLFKSAIEGLDTALISDSMTPRNVAFALPPLPELILDVQDYQVTAYSTTIELNWSWFGANVDERYQQLEDYIAESYEVTIQEEGEDTKIFNFRDFQSMTGSHLKYGFSHTPGTACFSVKGLTPDGRSVQSNQVCVVEGVVQ